VHITVIHFKMNQSNKDQETAPNIELIDPTKDEDIVVTSPSVTVEQEDNFHHCESVIAENENKEESGETTDTSSEKNESKDFEDEDIFQCIDCKTTECVMWRKGDSNEGLVCNLCHLKRVKTRTAAIQAASNQASSANNKSNQYSAPTKVKDVRISKRKNKTNKKFTNGFYGDRIIKNSNSKSRRNFFKKKPVKSVLGVSSIVASQSIYHNVSLKKNVLFLPIFTMITL